MWSALFKLLLPPAARRARLSRKSRRGPRRGAPLRVRLLEGREVPSAVSWAHPASGDWDTAANWSTGVVPTANDDVTIAFPGITVTHNQAITDSCHSLTDGSATLNFTAGQLNLGASSSIGGNLLLGGGFPLSITGTLTLTGGGTASGSAAYLLQSNSLVEFQAGTYTFGGATEIRGPGSVDVAARATVVENGLWDLIGNNSASSIEGSLTLGNGVAQPAVMGPLTLSGTLTDNGPAGCGLLSLTGTLQGSGVTTAGGLTWTGGSMLGSGTTVLSGGISNTLSGGVALGGGRTLEIFTALLTWTGGNISVPAPGATMNIDTNVGNFYDATDAGIVPAAGATMTINNYNAFEKTAGTNQTLTAVLNNYGPLMQVNSGNLTLVGGGTWSGGNSHGKVAAGSTLTFKSGTWLFEPGIPNGGGDIGGQGAVAFGVQVTAQVDSSITPGGGVTIGNGDTIDGVGHFSNTVSNGTIAPGTPSTPGAFHIDGNYTQNGLGQLLINVQGKAQAGVDYGELIVSGTAVLAGTLTVQAINGWTPNPATDVHTVMSYAAKTGDFVVKNLFNNGPWVGVPLAQVYVVRGT
jgi:hypothetical protein